MREFAVLAKRLEQRFPDWPVEHGYLEFANPVLRDGLQALKAKGVSRILAVPGMLFAAAHAKNDIPTVLNTFKAEHGIAVDYGRELGVDPKMVRAAADRVQAAVDLANAREEVPLSDTCLVVIGRGASDPDANANVARIGRLLWEGMGFGWSAVGYSGVTFPVVEPCLEQVAKLGFRRVIVFPYFLFTGILIDRIYGFTDRVAERFPTTDFVKAGYLNDHDLVVETFAERVTEILEGRNAMDCSMCKYRTQVLGFETEVGLPQSSHHHHVEGQGASAPGSNVAACTLCDDFCTGACRVLGAGHHHNHTHEHADGHDHHHAHRRYPHDDHPLGPVSVLRDRKT